ncbi:metallopeptidase TldD-related protein [Candidatus Chlorohelix sp.]|uniref:TldD/PmbA family protein n=1 Tax=Candidatus Chlorohelix sp. TaxID=3139201 RepID=UPI003048F107
MTTENAQAALGFFQARYGIDQTILNDLLAVAMSRGGDFAELYSEYRQTSLLNYEDQAVRQSSGGITQGMGIRVVQGDAVGYAYSEDFSVESLKHAATTAAQIANSSQGKVNPIDATILSGANLYPIEKPTIDARALEKLEIIRRVDKAARAHDPSISKVSVIFADELKRVLIATSDGRLAADVQPLFTIRASVIAEKDGKRERGFKSASARRGLEYFDQIISPEEVGVFAAKQAVTNLGAIDAPAGIMPVVLGAGESGVLLHEAVGHGLEGDFNYKKLSNYSDRVGEKVASELCTVIDDGTVPHTRGTLNIDDEGNPTQYNVLIENGLLRGYMQDRISSAQMSVAPTGNGRRESFRKYPMTRMTNTYMLNGETPFDDLIKAVPRGLYCVEYGGGQVDINSGDFVFIVTEAYMIEEGKITTPVKGVNLIGNGPEVLSKVTMVGNDFQLAGNGGMCGKNGQSVPVSLGMPSVLVSSITVGGTAA